LHEVLDIPNGNRFVCELSGGEQRRVSLALTLLNNSCLIILDEPTVGIDMIITSGIWKYLNYRCKEGLTILFVTQYVEEATHANRVGFMRNGRMLEENSPTALMKEYKELRLEKIFLKLCQKEDNQSLNNYVDLNNKNKQILMDSYQQIEKDSEIFPKRQNYSTALWILFVLIQKNILKLTRMGFPSLLIILLPAIQAIAFCLLFSKESIEVNVITSYSFCLKIQILCALRKPSIF
jgi:ABC-type multidrug transport system ATPase subunit